MLKVTFDKDTLMFAAYCPECDSEIVFTISYPPVICYSCRNVFEYNVLDMVFDRKERVVHFKEGNDASGPY